MIFNQKTNIEILKEIDTSRYQWCSEALLISVKNGLASLTKRASDYDEDYHITSQLLLHETPLIQGSYPVCPTCSALLARGYGIEQADCPELLEVRDRINQDYTDIRTSAEYLKPLLGLLEDGYYILADVRHTPTDGGNRFFANVPDKPTYFPAACDAYYNHVFITATNGFPAYLYPTQSNACLNLKHAESYVGRIDKASAPRAIAYYHYGFMSALLDGHHKAYAAAMLGVQVPCLTIIPMTGMWKRTADAEEFCQFSDIELPKSDLPDCKGFPAREMQEISIVKTGITNAPISEQGLPLDRYLTIEVLTGIYTADLQKTEITSELVREWLHSDDRDDLEKLQCTLLYLAKTEPEYACQLSKLVIAEKNDMLFPTKTAFRILLQHKSPETEQLFLDYVIEHDAKSYCWDVVTSYWEDEA